MKQPWLCIPMTVCHIDNKVNIFGCCLYVHLSAETATQLTCYAALFG